MTVRFIEKYTVHGNNISLAKTSANGAFNTANSEGYCVNYLKSIRRAGPDSFIMTQSRNNTMYLDFSVMQGSSCLNLLTYPYFSKKLTLYSTE